MKKFIVLSLMCLMALTINAQRYAILEFDAAKGISITQVDGISEMFSSCFSPQGYTEVDRSFYDRIVAEQDLQHNERTEDLAVRVGRIKNVSKVVVGKVSMLGGKYQVDVKVLDVETEQPIAKDGITVSGDYRNAICSFAKRVAAQIAITPGTIVSAAPSTTAKKRTSVEVLYGYLKIFPNELGVFQSEPTSVIRQINAQAQHGYNNWRIPTNEELSLMRANGYLGGGEYMTRESKHGIVLLVTDGKDHQTLQAEEQARIKAEQERRAAEERAKQERLAYLKAQGLVDLGLPSGTLWKDKNEEGGFYTYEQALNKFGDKLPTKEQFEELKSKCQWSWTGSGYKVTGPNGNSISLPAAGWRFVQGDIGYVGSRGGYPTSMTKGSENIYCLCFYSDRVSVSDNFSRFGGYSIRLVQD